MVMRQATEADFPFVDEMLGLAANNPAMGIGYPGGSFEDMQKELSEIDKTISNSILIIENNNRAIGIIGIYDAPWGLYLIGPIFAPQHHSSKNIAEVIPTFLNSGNFADKTVIVDAKEGNAAMVDVLETLGFEHTYSGASMRLNIGQCAPKSATTGVSKISLEHKAQLERVCEIFDAYLPPWRSGGMNYMEELLEGGAFAATVSEGGSIVGGIVWERRGDFNELNYLCIDKEYQSKGYGRRLLDYVIEDIRSTTTPDVEHFLYLDVAQDNVAARDFYTHCGFETEYLRMVYTIKTSV